MFDLRFHPKNRRLTRILISKPPEHTHTPPVTHRQSQAISHFQARLSTPAPYYLTGLCLAQPIAPSFTR